MQPQIAFLGVCNQAAKSPGFNDGFDRFDFLGLGPCYYSYLFPMQLKNLFFVFALYNPEKMNGKKIVFTSTTKNRSFFLEINTKPSSQPQYETRRVDTNHTFAITNVPRWVTLPIPVTIENFLINEPETFVATTEENGVRVEAGVLAFGYVQALELTQDRIAAIKSHPYAAKEVRYDIGCKLCKSKKTFYVSLERTREKENENMIWYSESPELIACTCGASQVNGKYIKENMHAMLGSIAPGVNGGEIDFLYRENALVQIRKEFIAVLKNAKNEEDIQKFIEDNTILLHSFNPNRIIKKGPILTKYKSDFIILSEARELFLIEIEPALSRIHIQGGDKSRALNHAVEQVLNWMHELNEHRQAGLECLGLRASDIARITGVVICGREGACDVMHLKRIKASMPQNVALLTYDDLANGLAGLARSITAIR